MSNNQSDEKQLHSLAANTFASGESVTEFTRLKELLVGSELQVVRELQEWKQNPDAFNSSISEAVSEAITIRSERDNSVALALGSTIEQSLSESVKNNPEPLADALYPVMGPAIRRSIAETMNQTLENFNRVLEHSLSPRSMKWRLQALISGKSFAEVALLHSLDYQVVQVFLIHRETSLLIEHAVSDTGIARDADMVSSMLSAIQDFVTDSFSVESGDTLSTLRLGELTVCIEAGPRAVIAAAVRGSVPDSLRTLLLETLESVHRTYPGELDNFNGDATEFSACGEQLEACLIDQHRADENQKDKKPPVLAIVALCIVSAVVMYKAHTSYQHEQLIASTIAQLNAEPGIVVISQQDRDGSLHIEALRDPLAPDLDEILGTDTVTKLSVISTMHPWHSLDPLLIEQRVAASLQNAPETIDLALNGGELSIIGNAKPQWLNATKLALLQIPGVESLNIDSLELIEEAPPLAAALPDLAHMSRNVERQHFYYNRGSTAIDRPSQENLESFIDDLVSLANAADAQGLMIDATINGFSDRSGSRSTNIVISLERANSLFNQLQTDNLKMVNFSTVGRGSVSETKAASMINPRHARVTINLRPQQYSDQRP